MSQTCTENHAQRVERWEGTDEELEKKLFKFLEPEGNSRHIDQLQVLPKDTYRKTHVCFVIWHWIQNTAPEA